MSDINTQEIEGKYTGSETDLLKDLAQIKTIKEAIKTAITGKGKAVTTFDTYAEAINQIETEKVDMDFTEIGYSNNGIYGKLINGFAYAKTKTEITEEGIKNDKQLVFLPANLDYASITNFDEFFSGDSNLQEIPVIEQVANATSMQNMFAGCINLSEASLKNILAMCISATQIGEENKTLAYLGLTFEQGELCKTLDNYTQFTEAGWTTGLFKSEDLDTEIEQIKTKVQEQATTITEMQSAIENKTSAVAQESESIVNDILGIEE